MVAWIITGWIHIVIGIFIGILLQRYVPTFYNWLVGAEQAVENKIKGK